MAGLPVLMVPGRVVHTPPVDGTRTKLTGNTGCNSPETGQETTVVSDTTERCTLCAQPLPAEPVEDSSGTRFCSNGCRNVQTTLAGDQSGSATEGEQSTEPREHRSQDTQTDSKTSDTERTFLRVDGMHSVSCEEYLETVADGCEGVVEAEASYVTQTVQVEHDPAEISQEELCTRLTRTGYSAVPREDAPINARVAARQGERRLESFIDYRYAAGVVFGSFLMITYVTIIYPAHLSTLLGEGMLDMYSRWAGFSGEGTVFVLRLYLALTGVVLFFTGLPLLRGAYVSLKMRQPNTELLVTIPILAAYLYSAIAVVLGRTHIYFDMTIVISAVVVAALFYETVVKRRAMDRLTDLTVSQLDEARLIQTDGSTEIVPIENLEPGDEILVREGERIPVDGELAEGQCTVDEAVITGESLPVSKETGDPMVGGGIVTSNGAVMTVTDRARSSIERLVTTVWNLQSAEHGVNRRANRLAILVVPLAGLTAVAAGVMLLIDIPLTTVLLWVLLALMIGSPWALGLATPLSVATSIEKAARRGIVVFDETVFERLRDVDTVVFDKTGTLTTGEMHVVDAAAPAQTLQAVARLEQRASHPAAAAIRSEYGTTKTARTDGGNEDDEDSQPGSVSNVTSYTNGIEGTVDGTVTLVGTLSLFEEQGWTVDEDIRARVEDARGFGRLPVVVGQDGRTTGIIIVGDQPRDEYDETVSRLNDKDIEVVVLTGDDEEAARFFEEHSAVEHVFAGVRPEGKTETIRLLQRDRYVTMVGDGTNDAPALAAANLGISLGSGTAMASDAADIALVEGTLSTIEQAFELAHAARRRLVQNNALALLYNAITIPLAATGLLNPLLAMGAVVVTSGLITWNAFRELRIRV
jgi:heavy metal translocating P-type ATPase